MSINFSCACGKTLQVKDELAGRKVRCPVCSAAVAVPQPGPAFEVVDDEPAPTPRRPTAVIDKRDDDDDDDGRGRKRRRDDDDDDRPRGKRRQFEDDDDDEEDDRPRRKKPKPKKKAKPEKHSHFAMEKGILNSGVAGGLLAMIIAGVWLVVGLMNDRFFFYTPILFVVGLLAFFKGLMGGGGTDEED